MFITSEEKAKKIRDEEQHQFDNPLNPNLPMMAPIVRGAAFGGAIGGIGGPGIQVVAPGQIAPPPPPGVELPPAKAIEPEKQIEAPPGK
jgi:hypothetical protein